MADSKPGGHIRSETSAARSQHRSHLLTMNSGRDLPFGDGWLFHRGGGGKFQGPDYDDRAWRLVDLPHDWGIEDLPVDTYPDGIGPFSRDAVGGMATGFTVGGEGWYRKHFAFSEPLDGKRVEIQFGGAHLETEVFLNGHSLGKNFHGYIPFTFDLTPYLATDGKNMLAVRVTNEGRNSRWYAGSGIYRQVTLDILPQVARLGRWGVAASTQRITPDCAEISISTVIEGATGGLNLETRLLDRNQDIVASEVVPADGVVQQGISVANPKLWSPSSPELYELQTLLCSGNEIIDSVTQPFGIRIITFDPAIGMTLNGTTVQLRGGCIHHDNGLLGACAYADADDRRIGLLKARGFNAIRSAHNPISRTLRSACDKLGMLVIDEAFDMWHEAKEPDDFSNHFAGHWEDVIRAMVLPARNSPSVIMWSIGNEIPLRSTDEGVEWQWKLARLVKQLDPTRPVTAGLNGVLGAELIAGEGTAKPGQADKIENASTIFLDIPGYNYRLEEIEAEQSSHPERVVYASETFAREVFDYAALVDRVPSFIGEFVWTAMDYIGEAALGATAFLPKDGMPYYFAGWPWINAWCGDLDLLGHQKAPSLARDVAWGLSSVELLVERPAPDGTNPWVANWGWRDEIPCWTWREHEGHELSVWIYSSAEEVELLLNGKSIATKRLSIDDKMTCMFTVPYVPGRIEAVARSGGRIQGRSTLETAGEAKSLRLVCEPRSGRTGREPLAYVQVQVCDERGNLVPDDERPLTLTIEGPARLLAFGNANPLATGSLQSNDARAFRGRALAILQINGSDPVQIVAQSPQIAAAASTSLQFEMAGR